MAIIFVRTLILYFSLLVSMRLMGKRQLGEMELSEFIVAALIADLAATPLQDIGIPLLNGLVPIITLFCLEVIIAGLSLHSVRIRKLFFGTPGMIIRSGQIDITQMRANRFTLDELMQELRSQGVTDIGQIEYAVLETNGQLNVILAPRSQPVTAELLGISTPPMSYPHIVINDGRVLTQNLRLAGKDECWLERQLACRGIKSPADVYCMTLTDSGAVRMQLMTGEVFE